MTGFKPLRQEVEIMRYEISDGEWAPSDPLSPSCCARPVLVTQQEHVPPDAQAALAWLQMHFPQAWGGQEDTAEQKPSPAKRPRLVVVLPDNGRE